MNLSHRYLLLVFLQLSTVYYACAGCSFLPALPIVAGNYIYDSINATYYFQEGDTLLFIYNGTGGGDDYVEDYYFNSSLIGNMLDTVKVFNTGTYSVEHGCGGGMTYHHSRTFLFSSNPTVTENLIDESRLSAYFNQATNSVDVFLGSGSLEYYNAEVYSVTGQKFSESKNLMANNIYSLPAISNGLNIVRITNSQGKSFIRKVIGL